MDRFVSPLVALLASFSATAADVVARPDWQKHFDAFGVQGTFVLLEPASDRYLVLNESRAKQGFIPASTFKIPNALIGLEVGSIADENEVFHWDGKPKMRHEWERDQTLATGMKYSVVWMFQEIARRTGKERMQEWIDRLGYGNKDIRGGIDQFWLQGQIRITAFQQVEFLRKLSEGELPMTQRSQRLVREALVVEKTPVFTLYAKSGSTGMLRNPVNWWVGWVERKGKPRAYFAMNFIPTTKTRYEDRIAITRAILDDAGVLPSAARPS
jgi:beta-lactamase class D